MQAFVVDPLREGVPEEWTRFTSAERLPAVWDRSALQILAWCSQTPTYLAVVADDSGVPLALFHLCHLGFPADPRRFVGSTSVATGILDCRLPPTLSMRGYVFAAAADQADRATALVTVERTIRMTLGRRAVGILYRNVPPSEIDLFADGRVARLSAPEAVIENRWSSIDGFLATLHRKRRTQLGRIDAMVRRAGIVAAEQTEIEPGDASRLASAVRDRHRRGVRIQPPLPAAYFTGLARHGGVRFLTYYAPSGQLLAFDTLLEMGDVVTSHIWGSRSRRDGGRRELYRHMHLRTVTYLIERGFARLVRGKGLPQMKLELGAELEPRYVVAAR